MKKQLIFVGATLATLACLAACGDETTNNVTETTGMSIVKAGDKTPDCTADNEGEMVYVADSAAAFFCADGKWQSLKGEQGKQGEPGEAGVGEQGPQGPKGEDGVGTQGDPGAAGKSCTAQKLASDDGYKIVCGGDSVGVVMDGGDGASAYELSGSTLSQSEWLASLKGENGTSCSATQVTGGVQIDCTDGTSVTLNDGKSFVDGWMVDPRDKQLYRTVTIGDQVWMAENLNYAYTAPTKNNTLDSSSFCYDNDPANCAKYGRLYLWSAAMDSAGVIPGNEASGCGYRSSSELDSPVRGVCPAGWHLPDTNEFKTLAETVGGIDNAGTVLKSTSGWNDDGNGTDEYNFTALPTGLYNARKYYYEGGYALFWTSDKCDDLDSSCSVSMQNTRNSLKVGSGSRYDGRAVRCIKDSE